MLSKEKIERLQMMLTLAVAGDRPAFDSVAMFGEIDREAAQQLWKAGRLLALA